MESPKATMLRCAGPSTSTERTQRGVAVVGKLCPDRVPAEAGAPLVQPPGSTLAALVGASPAPAVSVMLKPVFGRTRNGRGSESTVEPGLTRTDVCPPNWSCWLLPARTSSDLRSVGTEIQP